jgi:hypothetical protein
MDVHILEHAELMEKTKNILYQELEPAFHPVQLNPMYGSYTKDYTAKYSVQKNFLRNYMKILRTPKPL